MEESRTPGQGRGLAACWQGLIASLASAVLFVLAFPPLDLPETAYVFAVPLLLHALFGRTFKGEGWVIFIAGWLAWLGLVFWLRNVTDHLSSPFAGVLGWTAALGLSGILAIFWWSWFMAAMWGLRMAASRGLAGRLGALLALAAFWIVLEWVRGTVFTGFPWLPLAASQWQRPLVLQVASLTGAGGVSFVLIAFNLGLSQYLHNLWVNRKGRWWQRLSPEFYLALAILFGAIGFGLNSSGAGRQGEIDGPRMAYVQPNVSAFEKWDSEGRADMLELLEDLSTYAEYLGAELILWPESPTPYPVKGNAWMENWVGALSRATGIPMLIGNLALERTEDPDVFRLYNAVFTVDPEAGVDTENFYAKRHLVPFGEYVPLADWIPFARTVVPVPYDLLPGESEEPLVFAQQEGRYGEIGGLICYEDIFAGLARKNVLAGADWHYVATNNAWFGEEAAAWQHAAHSVLRAVETRRPVVRCGNSGWSGWIDEFGHIRHVMTDDRGSIYFQGVEAFDFKRNRWWAGRQSLYVTLGDWFAAFCALLVGMGALAVHLAPQRRISLSSAKRFSGRL